MSFRKEVFFVSRQLYWVGEDHLGTVEVAQGGQDYSGSDMLVPKYAGEGEEYTGLTPAVKAAIEIAEKWRWDAITLNIVVAIGSNKVATLPFEGETDTRKLLEQAAEFDAKLPKCEKCGEILGSEVHTTEADEKCCSEHCAEELWREAVLENCVCEVLELSKRCGVGLDEMFEMAVVGPKGQAEIMSLPEDERMETVIRKHVKGMDENEYGDFLLEIEEYGGPDEEE